MENKLAEALKGFTAETKLEYKPRLDQKIIDLLNLQIQYEIENSHAYKAIAAWCSNGPWSNGYKYFMKRAEEEQGHANKIIEYLDDKNCKIVVPAVPLPDSRFEGMKDIFTKSLQREINTTTQWQNISNIAIAMKDTTTLFMSEWFVNEQIGEESEFRELLYKIDLGTPDWRLEEHLGDLL